MLSEVVRRPRIGRIKPVVRPRIGHIKPRDLAGHLRGWTLGVRIRLRLRYKDEVLETVALVNTGFETYNPQILLPVKAAEKLKLWPNLPPDALVEVYDTAGGPTRVYRVRNAVKVEVPERGISAIADAVISHTEVEVLVSDRLADELMIAIEKPGEGLWRFRDDNVIRRSESPEIWL